MSVSTIISDEGGNTRKIFVKHADDNTKVAAWHGSLQGLINGKVEGSSFITEKYYAGSVTSGKFDQISAKALCCFYTVDGATFERFPFKFALHSPKDSAVEYNADRGCYQLTAVAAEALRLAIETAAGLNEGDLVYVSGYIYDKKRKPQ